jgi:glutamate--cysteine ligase
MTTDAFKSSLKAHQEKGFFKSLKIHRGIERESLRVTQKGNISQKNHPENLGSPLTSKDITTDFAEALVELVTPTFKSAKELFDHLSLLHKFLYSEMGEEILWNFSMPCAFQNEKEIRIAEYGESNSGMLKHIYRKGLRLRYGSIMQCVSGIHYNFSLSKDSWSVLNSDPNQDFINKRYLGMIRNIKRNFWFLLERLSASPITHESYLLNREHSLERHHTNDLFLPNATSLRMSDVGYQSSVQDSLNISYNNLNEFLDAIVRGIKTPIKEFKDIGLLDKNGLPQQISTGILQIENELYDIVRPKRTGPSGSRPATLLKNEGIEYLELRGIDINPFIPEGIDENKIKLLDIFIIHSLISESPLASDEEIEEIKTNQKNMVRNGRSKDLKLIRNGVQIPLSELKTNLQAELEQTAKALDEYSEGYLGAFNSEMNANFLPSEKIMSEIKSQNLSFQDYGLAQSKKIAEEHKLTSNQDFSKLINAAETSLKDLKNLQENAGMDINKYVELYNSKI